MFGRSCGEPSAVRAVHCISCTITTHYGSAEVIRTFFSPFLGKLERARVHVRVVFKRLYDIAVHGEREGRSVT